MASVLLDYKFISLGSVLASSATFIISITFFLSDVITEVYGYRSGRQVVSGGVIALVCMGVIGFGLSKFQTPSEYATYGNAYNVILPLLLRACLSNAVAISFSALCNIYFLSKWKVLVKGKYFWLRSLGSSAIGESLYTLFVVSLLNIGMVNMAQFLDVLFVSYFFKLVFNAVAVIPACLLVRALKSLEGVDVYDFADDFTPFNYLKLRQKL